GFNDIMQLDRQAALTSEWRRMPVLSMHFPRSPFLWIAKSVAHTLQCIPAITHSAGGKQQVDIPHRPERRIRVRMPGEVRAFQENCWHATLMQSSKCLLQLLLP